jgi:RHS repeat-associated protein
MEMERLILEKDLLQLPLKTRRTARSYINSRFNQFISEFMQNKVLQKASECGFVDRLISKVLVIISLIGVWFPQVLHAADGTATKAISAGVLNSVVVKPDGTVWAWGHNVFGESGYLSVGASSTIVTPAMLSTSITNAVAVSSGGDSSTYAAHTLVLLADGRVKAGGANGFGQLGDGTLVKRTDGVYVTNLDNVVAIVAGGHHSLALKADGSVWGWGRNASGEIGIGTIASPQEAPVKVNNLSNIIAIAAGEYHSMALKSDGTVWAWGQNVNGQIGINSVATPQKNPVQVTNLSDVVAIATGGQHSMALKADGTVWGWGANGKAQVGIGNITTPQKNPVQAIGVSNVVAIASGETHSLALRADGTVWTWGENVDGELALGYINSPIKFPTQVPYLNNVMSISGGASHSLALLTDGTMKAWGNNYWGQLGNGASTGTAGNNNPAPVSVEGFSDVGLVARNHSLLVKMDGTIWAYGYNRFGQLGDGSTYNRLSPVEVNNQFGSFSAVAGGAHSLAINMDNSVWAWGNNLYGQLGDGTSVNRLVSAHTSTLAGIGSVTAGKQHSLALATNGAVYAWGANSYGQIGDGTTVNRSVAITVTNGGVLAIAAGWNHSLAVLTNKTVISWGNNSDGQLGDGTTSNRLQFVSVTNLSSVLSVAAGDRHSLALLTNGTVWAWGNNLFGQLGDGTIANRPRPVQVTNLTGIISVAAGAQFSAALSSNGTVWVWGYGGYGQVGNSANTNRLTPFQIGSLSGIIALQAGENHLILTMSDGGVQVLGDNSCGQVARGSWPNEFTVKPIDFNLVQADYSSLSNGLFATNLIRYSRGTSEYFGFKSVVSPLNFQSGVLLGLTGDNTNYFAGSSPWFSSIQKELRYHVQAIDHNSYYSNLFSSPLAFNNPIVSFGENGGGSPLYIGQSYRFGVFAGFRIEHTNNSALFPEFTNTIRIMVYARTNFSPGTTNIQAIATNDIYLPRQLTDKASWNQFASNGYTASIYTYGLRTDVHLHEPQQPLYNSNSIAEYKAYSDGTIPFGYSPKYASMYILTHTASDEAKNYYYRIECLGASSMTTNWIYMVTNGAGAYSRSILYTLDFMEHPNWRSPFIDQPHFNEIITPPFYVGKSLQEMTESSTVINYPITLSDACTNIDQSPELLQHPILDQFVKDMNHDPIALTRYVINEIALSDYMAFGTSNAPYASINLGGISRNALGTFLEKQGSPAEQCALLVYLLRQAGYKAAYLYPTNNNLLMSDTHLGNLLRMKIKGAEAYGYRYTTNENIVVNYPWVVANIGTNTVHLFPWLKDTQVTEGLNLYDYMPTNYNSAFKWIKNYLYGDPNIVGSIYESNSPAILFPRFIRKSLLANYPGISIDDLGVKIINRKHEFSRWEEFPTPDVITNISQTALVEDFKTITNTVPWLNNYFDVVSVGVQVAQNGIGHGDYFFISGLMRIADISNRKFIAAVTSSDRLAIWMAPFRTNASGLGHFGDYSTNNYLTTQSNSFLIGGDTLLFTNFNIVFTEYRHRFPYDSKSSNPTGLGAFLGLKEAFSLSTTSAYSPNEIAALCINVGRVTKEMLNVHAQNYWQLEAKKKANKSYSPSIFEYAGGAAYILGATFYKNLSEWNEVNSKLHKSTECDISKFQCGLAKLSGVSSKVQPVLDMSLSGVIASANNTLHPDVNLDPVMATEDYNWFLVTGGSAEEHHTINEVFQRTNAISTVALLQLSQQRASPGVPGIFELNADNFFDPAYSNLDHYDSYIYDYLEAGILSGDTFSSYAFVTPKPVSNANKSYTGMGALIYNYDNMAALIGGGLNGAYGDVEADFTDSSLNDYLGYSLVTDINMNYVMQHNDAATTTSLPTLTTTFGLADSFDNKEYNLIQASEANAIAITLQLGSISPGAAQSAAENSGFLGLSSFFSTVGEMVYDPVNPMTGEFYVDSVDLSLVGPMRLDIRRNYGSHNMADNQFGYGWKMAYMPYLVLSSNSVSHLTTISASEMDGSVIAYRQTATNSSLFIPLFADNPQLNNDNKAGIGSRGNLFNNSITNYSVGTNQFYNLLGTDGSLRIFQSQSFPVSNTTHTIQRIRPYLTRWQDAQSNYFVFSYGTNSFENDYGQVRRIQSSNGDFLGFYYDIYRHIIEAYTGDGRRLHYDYDDNGDLIKVTRPDASEIGYTYQFVQTPTNSYSTHMIATEIKPDGRILQNVYDSSNRVIAQLSTVGQDLNLYTNAQFSYSNNFVLNSTNPIYGYTLIKDINNNVTRYDYTNSVILKITDPLQQTTVQDWYWTNGAGGYQMSLKMQVDKRGLTNQYFYDVKGNLVTNIVSGLDLTGDGTTSLTNKYSFNSNNLLTNTVDAMGNKVSVIYGNGTYPFLPSSIERYSSNGTATVTNEMLYTYGSNIVVNGTISITNTAFGLLSRTIRAAGSVDAATNDLFYDGRGFVTNSIKYSGTADPNITNDFLYNARGELVKQTDAAGRTTTLDYDGLGQLISKEVFDTGGETPVSWENSYYNENGELTWSDGPRYGPEDYVWRDYDGAGRKTQEIHWRSRAKSDGSGVEAETGDNLYATMFSQYDGFGNLVKVTDQHGNYSRMIYDAIGQLVEKRFYKQNTPTQILTEKFANEAGGQISIYTNALGGITSKYYTTTGKLKRQVNPDGTTLQWTYYADGRPHREFLSNSNYYETVYDDANRFVKRTFSGDASYADTKVFDRRGNLTLMTNAVGAIFTTSYDRLDRVKQSVGPATFGNSAQQITGYKYDSSGQQLIVTNSLGEFTLSIYDALGRIKTNSVYDANSNLVSIATTVYSPDFNSVTTTVGSGTNAISTTAFTDTFGKLVLAQHFPSAGITNYTISSYDILENLTAKRDELGRTTTLVYDPLNRLQTEILPDGATNTFSYNAMGSLTNRVMPGGLTWSAIFDSANRMLSEQLKGGSPVNRQITNQFYTSGSNVGLLQVKTDSGRNVSATLSYDAYLRVVTNSTSGSLSDQNLTLIYKYDQRGLATNLMQVGLVNYDTIQRVYDGYGQMSDEKVYINGVLQNDFYTSWNSTARRSQLALAGAGTGGTINYSYRADGLLTNVLEGSQNYAFTYRDNGLLASRINPWRSLALSQRDGQGRLLQETATVGSSVFSETNTWLANSQLASYTAGRVGTGAWNDSRAYQYNTRDQLTKEPIGVGTGNLATNSYSFDTGKIGVLTGAQWSGGLTNNWQATELNSLDQITSESWNQSMLTLRANGSAVNASSVSGTLDTTNISGLIYGNGRWYADLSLSTGSHTLKATAVYNGGQYSATATSAFSVVGSNNVTDYYDGAGNVTNRVFANGKTQSLIWDGLGRLAGVIQRDNSTNGFNWTAIYDSLGRRLRTVHVPVANGLTNSVMTLTLDSYFDPLVEFQELAFSVNGQRTWKVMGPDMNGRYGGMEGVGGLEATIREVDALTTPVLNDYFGNVLATLSGTNVNWSAVRVIGYGPVMGYEVPTLTLSTPLAETLLWRTRRIDPSGFYCLGARYYDPVAGHFLSPDPLGHSSSMDLYSFCNGDPLNGFDADGRLSASFYNNNVKPTLQSGYDTIVDRNGTPGPYNVLAQYVIGGTPSLLGLDPVSQDIYYSDGDKPTQALIGANDFQNGNMALPYVKDQVSQGAQTGGFDVNMEEAPWYRVVQDISGIGTGGLIGKNPTVAYTGSWSGTWSASGQDGNGTTTASFSGNNLTSAESNTRVPPILVDWGYHNNPTLVQNLENKSVFQNPVQNFQWNGWTHLPSISFQSPIVPFRSIVGENPFGMNGPFRSVTEHYNFQIPIANSQHTHQ